MIIKKKPEITVLDNNVTIATDKIEYVESVSVGTWFGVGTRHETEAQNGIAHLLEHMFFKGTSRRSSKDIAEQIEFVGGHLNAYTSREQTAFFARTLLDDVFLAVDILSDIIQNSLFDENELERERSVVLQEIGQAIDTPDDIIFDHFQRCAYPNQAIGRPVLGQPEVVSGLKRQEIKNFVSKQYTNERFVFAVAGNVEHKQMVELVEKKFASLPNDNGQLAVEPANYVGGDFREVKQLEQIHIIIGFPSVSYDHEDFYAYQVLSMLLGGGMSSRLFQEVREKRGLAYSIQSFTTSHQDGGLMGIYAGTGEYFIEEMLPVISDELNKLTSDDLEQEVIRAKTQLKAALLMSREGTANRCEQLAQQLIIHKRFKPITEIVEKLEKVDSLAVRKIASAMLANRPTLAALGPISRLETYSSFEKRFV